MGLRLRGGIAALCELPLGNHIGAAAPNKPAMLAGSSVAACHNAATDIAFQCEQTLGRIQQVQNLGAQYHSQPDGHAVFATTAFAFTLPHRSAASAASSRPFCIRFNSSLQPRRQHYGFTLPYRTAATLDIGPPAKSYPSGSHTRLSTNHFQFARSRLCYLP